MHGRPSGPPLPVIASSSAGSMEPIYYRPGSEGAPSKRARMDVDERCVRLLN